MQAIDTDVFRALRISSIDSGMYRDVFLGTAGHF